MAVYHVIIGDMSYWNVKKDVLRVTGVIRVLRGGVSLLLQLVNHKIMNKTKTIITTKRWQSKFTSKSRINKRSQRGEHECKFACFHLRCIVFLQKNNNMLIWHLDKVKKKCNEYKILGFKFFK